MNSQQNSRNHSQSNPDRSPNTSFQQWGSPAGPGNVRFSPYQNNGGAGFIERSPRQRQYSPRVSGYQNGNFCFRTPQPMQRVASPQNRSWTGGDYNKRHYNNISPVKRFHNFKNNRFDASCNPGGSKDIEQYYHPSMVQDPWQFLKPCSLRPSPTTL